MPPSVVRSSRFSGTMQAAWGLAFSAMASISSGGGHFEIERNDQRICQAQDVVVGDVAAVFTQMRRNAIGVRSLRQYRGTHWIGIVTTRAHCAPWRRGRC